MATAQAFAAKLSVTAWLLGGGLVLALIASFCPFVSVSVFGATVVSVGLPGYQIFITLLIIAGAAFLAWPIFSGSAMPMNRLIGLTVAIVLLLWPIGVGIYGLSGGDSTGDAATDALVNDSISPGFGLLLYIAAFLVMVVGLVRVWMNRPKAQAQPYGY